MFEHIQECATQVFAWQGPNERFLVNNLTSCDIDQTRRLGQEAQILRMDEALGFGSQGAGDDQPIRTGQYPVELLRPCRLKPTGRQACLDIQPLQSYRTLERVVKNARIRQDGLLGGSASYVPGHKGDIRRA